MIRRPRAACLSRHLLPMWMSLRVVCMPKVALPPQSAACEAEPGGPAVRVVH